jgi:hypothetical protein
MKNFIRLYSFFLLFTVTSCSNKSNGDVVIKPSVKENAKPLTLKEVPTGEALDFARSCYVYDDVLVVTNYENSNKHLLEFYNINTMELKKQAILHGNGPDEVLNLLPRNYKDELHVDGGSSSGKLTQFNVVEFANNKDSKLEFVDYAFQCQHKYLLDNNKFLVVNPFRFVNKELGIAQDENRFIILDATDRLLPNGRIDAINVNTGGIMVNSKEKKICYYSSTTAEIEIYDFDLNLIKTITGPDDLRPVYTRFQNIVQNRTKTLTYAYTHACYDDSYMYLAYDGRTIDTMEYIQNNGVMEKAERWVFKFDWDGNVIDVYKVSKEKEIVSLSVTKNGDLYLCCKEEGLIKLFKAEL